MWHLICYYPFQFLVQVSCFLTVLLSATRMIALLKPLYIIRQKMVWGALIIALPILSSTKIVKWVAYQAFFDSFVNEEMMVKMIKDLNSLDIIKELESSKIAALLEMIWFILVGVMVLVVAVCSALTVRALNSPVVEMVGPGGLPDNSTNRRATVMVLLLSLVFIIINGTWIIIYLTVAFEFLTSEDTKEILDMLQDIAVYYTMNLVMMSATSLINPLIYIARNTGLNEYTRSSISRIGRMILKVLQGIGNIPILTG